MLNEHLLLVKSVILLIPCIFILIYTIYKVNLGCKIFLYVQKTLQTISKCNSYLS